MPTNSRSSASLHCVTLALIEKIILWNAGGHPDVPKKGNECYNQASLMPTGKGRGGRPLPIPREARYNSKMQLCPSHSPLERPTGAFPGRRQRAASSVILRERWSWRDSEQSKQPKAHQATKARLTADRAKSNSLKTAELEEVEGEEEEAVAGE